MKRVLPAALLATIAFTLPALAADPLLSRLAGTWTGRGSYQQSASSKQERVFCKITNTLVENGNALQQRGRCSVASNSGAVDGLIRATGGGRYSGSLNSLATDGPASLGGSGSGNRLTLSMSFIDSQTHQPAKSVTTMTVGGNGYRLRTTRREGGQSWTPTDIAFSK